MARGGQHGHRTHRKPWKNILCLHCEQNNVLPLLTEILLGTRMKYSNLVYLTLREIASLLKPPFLAVSLSGMRVAKALENLFRISLVGWRHRGARGHVVSQTPTHWHRGAIEQLYNRDSGLG